MTRVKKGLLLATLVGIITAQNSYATLMEEEKKKESYTTTQKVLMGAAVITTAVIAHKCLKSNPTSPTNVKIQSQQPVTVVQPTTLIINNNYGDSEDDSDKTPESPVDNSYTPTFDWEIGSGGSSTSQNYDNGDDEKKTNNDDNEDSGETYTGTGYGKSESRGNDDNDAEDTYKAPDSGWDYNGDDEKKTSNDNQDDNKDDNSSTKSDNNDNNDEDKSSTYIGTGYGDSESR